jgi:Na+-driven multidrug efflux pump
MALALLPAWGVASAAATLVGQNLGALRPDRAEAAVRIATRCNVWLFIGVGAASAALSDPIVRLFTVEPRVHVHAENALLITSLAFPLYALGMCLSAAFNGAGDTWTPTWTAFVCQWLGAFPLAWLLAEVLRLEAMGVFIALPASLSALALWRYILFSRGTWKKTIL